MTVTPSQLQADTQDFKDEVERRVSEAFEKEGYTKPDRDGLPERDNSLVRIALAQALGEYPVESKADRHEHGGRFVDLVSTLFPSVPGPSTYESYEDPDERIWAAAVWHSLGRLVDQQLKTVSMETLVEEMYGKTICRVTLHPNDVPTQFVYITEDIECILQDYSGPRSAAIKRAYDAMSKAMKPVITRHPQHGKRLISEFKKTSAKQLETSVGEMQLALEMTNSSNGNGADDE